MLSNFKNGYVLTLHNNKIIYRLNCSENEYELDDVFDYSFSKKHLFYKNSDYCVEHYDKNIENFIYFLNQKYKVLKRFPL